MAASHLQYGCGWDAPDGWVNFDSSPTLRFERLPVIGQLYVANEERFPANVRVGDIVRGLPVEDGSFQGIYCSHVLEHLTLEEARTALRNTYRYLAPGGTFRLVVPDLRALASRYVVDDRPDAAIRFLTDAGLGLSTRQRTLFGRLRALLGHSAHLWMWDEASLRGELEAAGFVDVRRAALGDAADRAFDAVERAERFELAVAMDATRSVGLEGANGRSG